MHKASHRILGNESLSASTFKLIIERGGLNFRAGQCVNLGLPNSGINREYSTYSGEQEPELAFLVREVEDGDVSPQLGHVTLTQQDAIEQYSMMVHYIKLMLCTGIIHGDLSEFNVLVDSKGPVIIDLPQAVNAAANNSAQAMFTRDVNNIRRYYAQFAPSLLNTHYAKEMWALFEEASLTPNTVLSGEFEDSNESADVDAVLDEIQAAEYEEFDRLERIKNADDE